MRPFLHIVAIVLALPQVLLCAIFLLLGQVTAGGTLGSLFVLHLGQPPRPHRVARPPRRRLQRTRRRWAAGTVALTVLAPSWFEGDIDLGNGSHDADAAGVAAIASAS